MGKVVKAWAVASRGRYSEHAAEGRKTVQKMELLKEQGISNALTTVQKNAYVLMLCKKEDSGSA